MVLIRSGLHYRREIFKTGLESLGYAVSFATNFDPDEGDVLVIWNRYGHYNTFANDFEKAGARVIVAENGYLGKGWNNSDWYALSLGHHCGVGEYPHKHETDPDYRFMLSDWLRIGRNYDPDGEIVFLPQRGIGEPGVTMPRDWLNSHKSTFPAKYRVRAHPGKGQGPVPLVDDLKGARAVVTWASGAALKAILLGIPCVHYLPGWIGESASTFYKDLNDWTEIPYIFPDEMLARLTWAMWNGDEIYEGEAFRHLLGE